MTEETIKKILASTPAIYNKIAEDFYQTRKKPWPIIDVLKTHLATAKNIIDVGCGSGRLSELINEDQNYLGLDNSSQLIKIAEDNYSSRPNINFQAQDIINLDQLPKQFDLALMIAVIHHLPTTALRLKTLAGINKNLKANGKLIITSWNLWQPDYRRHLFNYRLKILDYKIFSIGDAFIPWQTKDGKELRYVHSLSKRELTWLLQKSGFTVEEIYYEYQGKKSSRLKGKNLVAIARKS